MQPVDIDLGPFRLLYPVGRGATARVWGGMHRSSNTTVAIKIFEGFSAGGPAAKQAEDFAREVRAVARLDHGAIIRVHDYGTAPTGSAANSAGQVPDGAPFLVMDWHGQGTLTQRAGRMGFIELRAALLTLLDALAHAHARGVVHRDLKPANVLLGHAGPVLSDFGLVFTTAARSAGANPTSGTPNYMAPEQVRGDWRAFGPSTDLYALGCLAWALVTGRAPFAGHGVHRVMMDHVRTRPPAFSPVCPVPEGFEHWLRRLLAKKPTDRPQFAADAAIALMDLDASGLPDFAPAGPMDAAPDATVIDPPTFVALDETRWADGPARHGRPPRPERWQRPDPPWAPHLPDCGRALAELREGRVHGRQAVRNRLWRLLGEVVDGEGARILVLTGPAGIGKTRLMRWLARRAHELGQARVLDARHGADQGPDDGLVAALARHLRVVDMDDGQRGPWLRDRLRVDPALAAALAALWHPDGCGEVDGFRITLTRREVAPTMVDGLAALTARRPMVVQVDDAHWGEATLRLVEAIVERRPDLPLLFVLTVREADLTPRTRRTLDGLLSRPCAEHLDLPPLSGHVADVAGGRLSLTPETRDHLDGVTGGNPLFAIELLRHWLRTGTLDRTDAGFALTDVARAATPADLISLVGTHVAAVLHGLPEGDHHALELAAVLGTAVDDLLWRVALAEAGLVRPDEAVGRLLDEGLLDPTDSGFAFAHPTTREALVAAARRADRQMDWHGACARAIAARAPRAHARLATHQHAAGDPAAALTAWQAAILGVEDAWGAVTDADAHLLTAAARSARATGAGRRSAGWVALKVSWSAHLNGRKRGLGLRHARQAVDLAGGVEDPRLMARATRQLARCHRDLGAFDTAEACLDRSEMLARIAGDAASHSASRRLRATLAFLQGDLARADTILEDVLLSLGEPGVPDTPGIRLQRIEAWNQRGEIARRRGDLKAAGAAYRAALRVAGEDETWLPALIALNLALIDLARDDHALARARARRSRLRLQRAGSARYIIYAEAVLLACAAHDADADAWDQAWSGLGRVVELDFVYADVAHLLARAARTGADDLPARADRARRAAIAQYRALGLAGEADALRG